MIFASFLIPKRDFFHVIFSRLTFFIIFALLLAVASCGLLFDY